jgi:hyperosmotically inducible periplasmic protein
MKLRAVLSSLVFTLVLAGAALAEKQPMTDDTIHNNVMIRLANDAVVKGGAMKVDVQDGVVTLRGNVETQKQKDKATKVAKKVKGVKRVVNELNIVTRAPR